MLKQVLASVAVVAIMACVFVYVHDKAINRALTATVPNAVYNCSEADSEPTVTDEMDRAVKTAVAAMKERKKLEGYTLMGAVRVYEEMPVSREKKEKKWVWLMTFKQSDCIPAAPPKGVVDRSGEVYVYVDAAGQAIVLYPCN